MPGKYRLRYLLIAQDDLISIFDYLAAEECFKILQLQIVGKKEWELKSF